MAQAPRHQQDGEGSTGELTAGWLVAAAGAGEAEEIAKGAEDDPFLLSGCQLTGGTGTAVVIAVGTESRWGRIRVRAGEPRHLGV